jgi:hypothetical protein
MPRPIRATALRVTKQRNLELRFRVHCILLRAGHHPIRRRRRSIELLQQARQLLDRGEPVTSRHLVSGARELVADGISAAGPCVVVRRVEQGQIKAD